MKILTLLLFISFSAQAKYQQGYFKKNGKQVQSHFKTQPNSTKFDNYSTKGNANPYSSKKGKKKP